MKGIHKFTIFLIAVLILAACSRKKNTFLSRNSHAVSAEYNALYNGNLAFEQGRATLAQDYRDNFWEILPVERVQLEENSMLPGQSKDPNFNRAEEKAAKAIQKHSMFIEGKEYNPQIDEAYILLGKARYYDARFVPAIDAFNFILNRYPTSNSVNLAKVWKAKTNIRLNSEDVAIEDLQKMFREQVLDEDEIADGSASIAQAYINLDSLEAALPYIKMAADNVQDNELKGRYLYIKGQIYNLLNEKDSANLAFDEVIELKRKSPRVYMIAAYISKARNFNYEKEDRTALLELLQDLEKNRENRPYLDKIYNQMGEYYLSMGNIDTAYIYYNYSLRAYREDNILQAKNYETLAEINFDDAEYKYAGAYYDSTLSFLEEDTRSWRLVKKKRENLDDVIKYEDIAAINDSILGLTAMTDDERLAYFTDYTRNLKQKAVSDSIAAIKERETIANNEFYQKQGSNSDEGNETGTRSGFFYFYNINTVAFGKQEFKKVWGDRKLEDNWRRSSKQTSGLSTEELIAAPVEPIAESELYKPETYISKIPTDQTVIDSIAGVRNFAYYQLGLIYKDKYREYGLASYKLERLLSFDPEERLVLPAKYNLYKIYTLTEEMALADNYKNDIITNYPDSRYAEILLNPNTQLATDQSSPEFKYNALYKEFEASKYRYVINTCDEYISIYNGNDIVPKLELLKASAIGRQDGFEAYKKALNFVSLNYPSSDEGKQAQIIITTVLPLITSTDFVDETEVNSWKLAYAFNSADTTKINALKAVLDNAIAGYAYTERTVSVDYYDANMTFVIIHGFNSKLGARGFGDVLNERKKDKVKHPFFEISAPNYKVVQIHKNLDDYLSKGTVEVEEKNNPQN